MFDLFPTGARILDGTGTPRASRRPDVSGPIPLDGECPAVPGWPGR